MAWRNSTFRDSEIKSFPGFLQARDAASWPDRRRGTSNFLTWSLFLAEVLAAELLFGKGAKAAEDLDFGSDRQQEERVATDSTTELARVRSAEDLDATGATPLLDVASASTHAPPGGNAAAPPFGINGGGASSDLQGGVAAGGAGAADSRQDGTGSSDAALGADVSAGNEGELTNVISDLDPSVALDLGLDLSSLGLSLDLDGLLSDLTSAVDLNGPIIDLSLDGGLLSGLELNLSFSDAEATVNDLAGELANLTGLSIFGEDALSDASSGILPELLDQSVASFPALEVIGGTAGQLTSLLFNSGAASSEGSLSFAISSGATTENSLFEGERYTEYNLALNSGVADAVVLTGDPYAAPAIGGEGAELLTATNDLLDYALGDQDLLRGHSI